VKASIYIEDGVTQLVLTPESDWERAITTKIGEAYSDAKVSIFRGSFYECRGGYYRYDQNVPDNSLILRVNKGTEP
jgi:hypothetical protein